MISTKYIDEMDRVQFQQKTRVWYVGWGMCKDVYHTENSTQ